MQLVDGGYLSWIYGTRAMTMNAWNAGKRRYGRASSSLILMDHKFSLRRRFYPDYKSDRRNKLMNSSVRREKKERVIWFQEEVLKQDLALIMIDHPGFEADDLIAAISLLKYLDKPIPLVGVDKDLLQLPKGFLELRDGSGSYKSIYDYINKLPKTIQQWVKEPLDLLLVLALMGDSSDSVPRLIPSYELNVLQSILSSPKRFEAGIDEFGDDFIRNLYLTVLPGPWCFDPIPDPEEVPILLEENEYYEQSLSESLKRKLTYGLGRVFYHDLLHERQQRLIWELGFGGRNEYR